MSALEWVAVFPELVLLTGAFALLLSARVQLGSFWQVVAGIFPFVLALIIAWLTWPEETTVLYEKLLVFSPFGSLLKVSILLVCSTALAYSFEYLAARKLLTAEFFALAIFATCGMLQLVSANHFLTVYLGLELMSLSMYAMIALQRDNSSAVEAAMKYFVLGALASGLLLFGISLIYAATGTLVIPEVAAAMGGGVEETRNLLAFGLVFLVAGVAFKIGAAPFHMWLPDVYTGAPTAITLFISTAPKIAAFAMAIRVIIEANAPLDGDWSGMLAILAVASMAIGNITAIAQQNLKRMLAYSAIAHTGFMLLGLLAATPDGYAAALFYILTYALMTLGGFGMLVLLSRNKVEVENLTDMKGMARRNGLIAVMMLILMLSMAGIPPLVGFYAKLAVWSAAVEAGWTWLAVTAALLSVVGAFYYLRVVKLMYFDEPEADAKPVNIDRPQLALIGTNCLLVVVLGILPGNLLLACLLVFEAL